MPDELDAEIQRTRQQHAEASAIAEEAIRAREALKEKLTTLELAARLRPGRTTPVGRPEGAHSKGRQPGAISKMWRRILLVTATKFPAGTSEGQIAAIARASGLENIRPKDVRDRMTDYRAHGYVEPVLEGWRVSEAAVRRFKTDMADDPPEMKTAAPLGEAAD